MSYTSYTITYKWSTVSKEKTTKRVARFSCSSISSILSQVTQQSQPAVFPKDLTGAFRNASMRFKCNLFWSLHACLSFCLSFLFNMQIHDTASVPSIRPNSKQHMLSPRRIMWAFNPQTHHYPTECIQWASNTVLCVQSDQSGMQANLFPDSNHPELHGTCSLLRKTGRLNTH